MNSPWLGGGGRARPALGAPLGVRLNIPDLVAANTMAILYASRPEESRKRRNLEHGTRNKEKQEAERAADTQAG